MDKAELIIEANKENIKWNDLLAHIETRITDIKIPGRIWTIKDIVGHVVFWSNFTIELVELRLKGIDIKDRIKIRDQYNAVNQKVWEKIQPQTYPKVKQELNRALDYFLEFIHLHENELSDDDVLYLEEEIHHQRHHRASIKNALRVIK